MEHYFAQDGSYGNAENIVLIHTDDWTDDDFNTVIDAHENDRLETAKRVALSKHTNVRLLGL